MAKDEVTIYNLALSAAGTQSKVSLPTENSREAEICRRWYEPVRDQILCAAWWSGAEGVANLALLSEQADDGVWAAGLPKPPWGLAYAAPSDYLYPRHFESMAPFEVGDISGQTVIYTDEESSTFIYTKKQIVPSSWSSDLYMAIVQGLAAHIAMSLHGKVSRAQQSFGLANQSILTARVNNANQNNLRYDSIPDWLLARGVSASNPFSNFIYPYGPLMSFGTNVG